jgi:predicted DNA-binding WGR domain protein
VEIYLERIERAQNMARFYQLDVQPTLFGDWALICSWGRIGRRGVMRSTAFDTKQNAEAARDRQMRAKQRRGYRATIR